MTQHSEREFIYAVLHLKSFILQWAKHITQICNHLVSVDTFLNFFQPDTPKGISFLSVVKYMKVIERY